jgi:hypothetical protein
MGVEGANSKPRKGTSEMQDTTTTLNQIGNEALFITKASNFVHDRQIDTLSFQTGNKGKALRKIEVQYDAAADLYNVFAVSVNFDFNSPSFGKYTRKTVCEGAYSDMLAAAVIEAAKVARTIKH